jgi:transcriptional regulator with XRE-family HTH domain
MISAKLFLELLDILHKREWKSISALAKLAGISPSTFSRIVNGQTENVQADTVGSLARELGYVIVLDGEKWSVTKSGERQQPIVSEPSPEYGIDFSRTHWKSEEDRKKFYDAVRKLAEVEPNDREAIYRIINSMGK